ncbi:uncharacterized protein RJT21DRAFT_117276 [Scheffersomyces amazonensis]|uniref:uncharacterized protein n=1 Tax=Scheffersomyces amazonensis TaxID=1078765 RepID=UPI00315D62ED
MFTRPGLNLLNKRVFAQQQRGFKQSSMVMNQIFGTPASGVYSNIPFKVKTKYVPFRLAYWGILTTFFFFPFLTSGWQMYKAGDFDKKEE